jgi:hypothetical protein
MTHRLLILVCAAVCVAACSSNTPTHCYVESETICVDYGVNPEAADAGASLSFADASPDAAEGGIP